MSIGQLDPEDGFVVGAGDYNGDQKDDLLVRQYSTGTLGYYVCAEQSKWTELGNGVSMEWTVIACLCHKHKKQFSACAGNGTVACLF